MVAVGRGARSVVPLAIAGGGVGHVVVGIGVYGARALLQGALQSLGQPRPAAASAPAPAPAPAATAATAVRAGHLRRKDTLLQSFSYLMTGDSLR